MPSYKTKAVVLKTYNLGEADKIIKLFSGEYGLIDSVAKSARKIKSKFLGRLELFNFLELEISKGKSLDIITQAEIIKSFTNISKDFNKFLFCQLISNIVLKIHFSGTENTQSVFKLLYVCFNEINEIERNSSICKIEKAGSFFIAKFLKTLGYVPNLNTCCLCKKRIDLDVIGAFSIKYGGIICNNCLKLIDSNSESKLVINNEVYSILNCLFFQDLKTLKQRKVNIKTIGDILKILEDYFKFHTESNINITSYLKRVL